MTTNASRTSHPSIKYTYKILYMYPSSKYSDYDSIACVSNFLTVNPPDQLSSSQRLNYIFYFLHISNDLFTTGNYPVFSFTLPSTCSLSTCSQYIKTLQQIEQALQLSSVKVFSFCPPSLI